MTSSHTRGLAPALLAALAVAACRSAPRQAAVETAPQPPAARDDSAGIAEARADSLRHPYTKADIDFMTGMISHHAQAIVMAGWAPSHGASPSVQTLCARIINSQHDEIVTMQTWLRDRRQPVPMVSPTGVVSMPGSMAGMTMPMSGGEHEVLMPGMLTDEQMKRLDAARGPEFDRLFLTFMIQHHRGALTMVKDLFDSYGAAQDELTFKLASNINADQTTEIARMQRMLILQAIQGDSL